MAEYIEREAAQEALKRFCEGMRQDIPRYPSAIRLASKYIDKIPAADVVEVVHGRWIEYLDFWRKCSECEASWHEQWIFGKHMHYCSNCGAKMDG